MPVTIKDIAYVATLQATKNPIGEGPEQGDVLSTMKPAERTSMMERLVAAIYPIMDYAGEDHIANTTGGDYITRLSTNEFFFYTKEPLAVEEFQELNNKIAQKAEKLPPGVQLILGSFAVKTKDNNVANVAPHISCGPTPSFHFIVKSNTSSIDPHYSEARTVEFAGAEAFEVLDLEPLDVNTTNATMPKITINGVEHTFTFNNIVSCTSPDGSPVLVAVEICLDNSEGVVNSNITALVKKDPLLLQQSISHVLVSNTILPNLPHSFEPLMHVDTRYFNTCKYGSEQTQTEAKPCFGNNQVVIITVKPTLCLNIQEAQSLRNADKEIFYIQAQAQFEELKQLQFGDKDKIMTNYITSMKEKIKIAHTRKDRDSLIEELTNKVSELQTSKPLIESLHNLRKNTRFFDVTRKAEISRLYSLLSNMTMTQRSHLLTSETYSIVQKGIISLSPTEDKAKPSSSQFFKERPTDSKEKEKHSDLKPKQ